VVCRSVVGLSKTAEPIEAPLGCGRLVHGVLDAGASWRHLANTAKPSTRGGDAAFLSSFFDHTFIVHTVIALFMAK